MSKVPVVVMHEEPESEFSTSSATNPILVVAGILAGLSLLVCGGAAGYVALTAPAQTGTVAESAPPERPGNLRGMMEKDAPLKVIPFTDDAALVRSIAAKIFKIDIPPDFEPIEALQERGTSRAVFGKPNENAALLKIAVTDSNFPSTLDSISADDPIGRQALRIAESENGRTNTVLRATREKIQPQKRELTVLGQKVVFVFRQGKRVSDGKPVWKVWGAFGPANRIAALIFVVPESEFDEEAVVRMIESIRPPDDAESDEKKSADEQPKSEKSDDEVKREAARE